MNESDAGVPQPGDATWTQNRSSSNGEIDVPTSAAAGVAEGEISDATGTSAIALPRIVRALRHRDLRFFWAGNFLSNVGIWMQNVAQG